ncbi:MAG: type I 3-dehydroquinate dehydratase [Verrucomicrobia bacterium]|nr:type I 3-dehydroquinate dehydratase [Verrucomicrobiota bacterium]
MLCAVIIGPDIFSQVAQAQRADLFEFRFDLIGTVNLEFLRSLPKEKLLFAQPPPLPELFALEPAYCDIGENSHLAKLCHPATKVITSSHFKTPIPLTAKTDKLATTAFSSLDALKMLEHIEKSRQIGVCMGEDGLLSRVLGPAYGSPWTYAAIAQGLESAPGQPTIDQLLDVYRFKSLSKQTKILGLIGTSVSQSPGMLFHNQQFAVKEIDAVYLPLRLDEGDLAGFFTTIKRFPFGGLSVTMPFKRKVIPYLKDLSPYALACGAVNTIDRNFVGYNTDGPGGLDAIERYRLVRGKRVVVLGAGGVGLALAHEAKLRGAKVTHLNRTPDPASEVLGLEHLPSHYDVLIQATCVTDQLLIPQEAIDPQAVILEVMLKETLFAKVTQEKGCRVVSGKEMWLAQAYLQQRIWFPTC